MRRLGCLLLLVACTLAACGGGDEGENVEDILNRAFSQDMASADLHIESEVDLDGMLDKPIRIEADGPFRGNKDKLPSADIELRIGTDGGGQTITTGVLTTGDRAFVKFQDVYYEQPAARVRAANESIKRRAHASDRPLGELGLDPRSWLGEAKEEGDADVAGVETRHVSGSLDVDALMHNLNEFVARSSSALGGSGDRGTPPRLTDTDIEQLTEAVKDPTFDVYIGKEDDIIRRVSGRVEFEIPKPSRAGLGGLDGGTITFSVEFRNVNGDQEIEAPAKARPMSDLTNSLGGGGLLQGSGGEAAPAPPANGVPDAGGASDPEAFRRYSECLDKARPEDTEALQKCADLLK